MTISFDDKSYKMRLPSRDRQRSSDSCFGMKIGAAFLLLISLARIVECGDPVFDPATLMRLVLVPSDTPAGSIIYRIRASDPDFDYPLQFELVGQMGRLDVSVETLPCTKYNTICQANVILQRKLEPGRYVDFRVSVRNLKGRSNRIACSITGTNATTPRDTIFPHQPGLILVPEDAKRGTDLDIVIARKNPTSAKPLELELWGSPLFAIRQRRVSTENTEGTLFLIGPLDFEMQSMHHLTLLAVDPFVEVGKDTRNIAALEVVVVVQDVQDMPPVFTHAPPVTHLAKKTQPGDVVVKVKAEDGDKGAPRQIRYGLVSEGNPFTPFFNINETTGEVSLEKPVEDIAAISHAGAPILLTVIAEEVRLSRDEPEAMSTTVQLAFILPERENTPPYFENDFYITYLDENSPQGTALVFNEPYVTQVSDNDAGKNGVFSLSLLGNNGTFEISPNVAERHTQFMIKVRDNVLLDYEARKSVNFQILAKEVGPNTNLSTTANVTVYLNDVNDNAPLFLQQSYEVELPENITAGARVVQVTADDVDTGVYGKIQYTAILGYLNTSLHLDPISGMITIATNNHGFDREAMPDLHFMVEARDNDGIGIRVTVPLIIKLLDVNDNAPEFERSLYEFVLSPSLNNFTSKAFVKAIDKDAEAPNNIVQYEIIQGNTDRLFAIDESTGELYLLKPLRRINTDRSRNKRQFESDEESEVYVLTIRAYDLGVPRLFTTTMVKVYPPESKSKTLLFIVPGVNPDPKKTEEILRTITGGRISILEIRPYKGNEVGATDVSAGSNAAGKSVVVATVFMTGNSVIDVSHIKDQLTKNKTALLSGNSLNTANDHSFDSSGNNFSFYKAENRLLFWILILLAIIIGLVLLCLILCCICEGCPLYMPPRKRVIRVNSTEDDVHLMAKTRENRSLNKTMQSEWTGKREAWSAEADLRTKPTQWKFNKRNYQSRENLKPASTPGDYKAKEFMIPSLDKHGGSERKRKSRVGPNIIYTKEMQVQDAYVNKQREYMEDLENGYDRIATLHARDEDDSLSGHEKARGSNPRTTRDQFFIKDGETEILRLVTRGKNENERYVNLPAPRPMTIVSQIPEDSGKNLLLRRFINEQETENLRRKEEAKTELSKRITDDPNMEITSLNLTHAGVSQEFLESSLRRQNKLLHQMLADRERLLQAHETASQLESRLETQSLPGHAAMATQTECHAGTQTEEPRRARSDNESYSEDEEDTTSSNNTKLKNNDWMKRRKPKKKIKFKSNPRKSVSEIKRKIRTPILEENEPTIGVDEKCLKIRRTFEKEEYIKCKTESVDLSENERGKRGNVLHKEVLLEISDSLEDRGECSSGARYKKSKLKRQLPVSVNSVTEQIKINDKKENDDNTEDQNKFKEITSNEIIEYEKGNENEYETLNKSSKAQSSSSETFSKKNTRVTQSEDDQKSKMSNNENSEIEKAPTKYIPRYMQWYAKKSSDSLTNQKKMPDKPKRLTKVKSKSLESDHSSSYGKISGHHQNKDVKKPSKSKDSEFKIHPRLLKEEQVTQATEGPLPNVHPLLQHSQHRYEHQYENQNPLCYIQPTHIPQHLGSTVPKPAAAQRQAKHQPIYVNREDSNNADGINGENVATKHNISILNSFNNEEKATKGVHVQKIRIGGHDDGSLVKENETTKAEDDDSGIALHTQPQGVIKRIPITEKKSVFTIAYDDVHTKQLRPDSSSTSH